MATSRKTVPVSLFSPKFLVILSTSYWICGVREEGDVLCGKVAAAMCVFPQHIKRRSFYSL
jgi:hypothetical protein